MRQSIRLHPAEEWLANNWLGSLSNVHDITNVVNLTKERIRNYINEKIEESGQVYPPFNPEKLFAFRNIVSKIETNLPNKYSGVLEPALGGFIIKVNANDTVKRKRFTIAHELSHTFFFDLNNEIPLKRFTNSKSLYWVEEDYSNSFAAEILVPAKFSVDILKDYRPTLPNLLKLNQIFQVSSDVLLRQCVRNFKIWDCLYFYAELHSDDTIITNSNSIVKGISFKKNSIPKEIKLFTKEKTLNFENILSLNFASSLESNSKLFSNVFILSSYYFKLQILKLSVNQQTHFMAMITKSYKYKN